MSVSVITSRRVVNERTGDVGEAFAIGVGIPGRQDFFVVERINGEYDVWPIHQTRSARLSEADLVGPAATTESEVEAILTAAQAKASDDDEEPMGFALPAPEKRGDDDE